MPSRFQIRLTRFDDQTSFQRVVDLLEGLYPERDREEFEAALARLPCTLSDDATAPAAEELKAALARRGASVVLIPVAPLGTAKTEVASTQELSPEIDLSFLDRARRQKKKAAGSPGSRRAGPGGGGKAPWEE